MLIGGESPAERSSPTAELYEPGSETTKTLDIGFNPNDLARAFHWFDAPLVLHGDLGGTAVQRLDWQFGSLDFVDMDEPLYPPILGFHLLPDGSFLEVDDADLFPYLTRYWVGRPRAQAALAYPEPRSLRMNDVVDFERTFPGHPFPGTAAEGSSGATTSSPSNLPVAAWFPGEGGWPSMGTITKKDAVTTYRVPRTPFPGFGFLFLATDGELEGVGPLTIEPSPDGNGCTDAGECTSGFCVDGVCCESACDGSCEACSRAAKGIGGDGVCSIVEEGTPEDACDVQPVSMCGHDGTCNARGRCAKYPDGTECGPGDVCTSGVCRSMPSVPPSGDGGAGGEPSGPEPQDACDGESTLSKANGSTEDCSPYRCPTGENRCARPCESNRDCVGGNVCASGRCEASLDVTRIEGCGCRVPGSPRSPAFVEAGYLVALAFLGRRLRRRRPWRELR
jgi:MYXO-CTERM domain-containing protein